MMIAANAKQQGHEVNVFLTDEAVIFGKKGMADYVVSMAGDEMSEYLDILIREKVPIYICRPCADVRDVREEDLIETAEIREGDTLVGLAVDSQVFNY